MPGEQIHLGRLENGNSQKSSMNVGGESDACIVPTKCPNKNENSLAEGMEGRRATKENTGKTTALRTQSRVGASSGLTSVRRVARQERKAQFTALLHHITVPLLRESFQALKRYAAPGIDGMKWKEYEKGLDTRLEQLHSQVHRGTYRAQPSKRTYIPKADGRRRPLGVAALEDKIVQYAAVEILKQVYEEDFLGFSYGFRPGRSQHDALDALSVGIVTKKVDWVLDADIQDFFGSMSHEWTLKFMTHRIADRRILRLIRKWLKAGVTEEGRWSKTEVGTPQGAVVSPLLANIYLHYVFDLWVQQWRRRHAKGDVIVVRYADDIVLGFQYRGDAERFLREWRKRMAKFGLQLHPDKTRLLEFGRYAELDRKQRGAGKPETFDFLGFTHMCGKGYQSGKFYVRRKTMRKRLHAKLRAIKGEIRGRWHEPVADVGKWLRSVVQGHYNYYGVPGNSQRLNYFRDRVIHYWRRALRRRSQTTRRITWVKVGRLADRWIPKAMIVHPHYHVRFAATHPR